MGLHSDTVADLALAVDPVYDRKLLIRAHVGVVVVPVEFNLSCKFLLYENLMSKLESLLRETRCISGIPIYLCPVRICGMNVLVYDIPCVHNLFSVSSVVYVIHNGLHVHLQTGIHLGSAHKSCVRIVVLTEKLVRCLGVPYQRMRSHLETVVVADIDDLINRSEVDRRHDRLRVVRRDVISLLFRLCYRHGSGSPEQGIRFHLILKRDTVIVLLERVEIIRILELT